MSPEKEKMPFEPERNEPQPEIGPVLPEQGLDSTESASKLEVLEPDLEVPEVDVSDAEGYPARQADNALAMRGGFDGTGALKALRSQYVGMGTTGAHAAYRTTEEFGKIRARASQQRG